MIALQIARIIANFMIFLNFTDDDIVNPDAAVELMEGLAGDIQELDKGFLRELIDAFPIIALEYHGEAQHLVRDIAQSLYLEEALAADDPVRLAELEALRYARD